MSIDVTVAVSAGLGFVFVATACTVLLLAVRRARARRESVTLQAQTILKHLSLLPDNSHHIDWHLDDDTMSGVPLSAPLLPQQTLLYADELGQGTKRVTTINRQPFSRYRAG